jgi:RNA polymerase sigma-70 factor (ECF subfamily)
VPCRDAEDIAHDVFFAVWRQFDKYDESRPIKTWLYVFVAYLARDYKALACNSRLVLRGAVPETANDEPAVDDRMQIEEERQIALQAVNRLEPTLHEVLMLNVAGWTAPKIAATLGIPLDTAYTRVRRAREKVHRYATCRLAEQERRGQVRQVFPAVVPGRRNRDGRNNRPLRS